ncbi:MAG TPA: rRNA maturation RNase YbeY [Phycisphaerae bacterium]|nr:rRNA maturation RNase YbeY [Phycisphaerae bacterium]
MADPMDDEPGQHIHVSRRCDCVRISQAEIKRVAAETVRRLGYRQYDLSVALLDDAAIGELHWRYRRRRGPTDVLSFDLRDEAEDGLEGEIVVSAETARRQGRRRRIAAKRELLLYLVHGILHLAGYDDATTEQADRMHRKEDMLLAALGYGRPFSARLAFEGAAVRGRGADLDR